MVFAVLFFFQHIYKKSCKVVGVSRCTDLVIYNSQGIMCFAKIDHGLDEVFAVQSEYPCNTHDVVLRSIFFHGNFTFVFGLSIDIQRLYDRIIRLPRADSLSVKHIVCADVYHRNVEFSTHLCNICCSIHIYFVADLLVILRCIHSSPRCTVDNFIRMNF